MDQFKFGQYLRSLRKFKKLTQKDVAERSGIAYATIQDIEKGKVNSSIITLNTLCQALGQSLSTALSRSGVSPATSLSSLAEAGEFLSRFESLPPQIRCLVLAVMFEDWTYMASFSDEDLENAIRYLKSFGVHEIASHA